MNCSEVDKNMSAFLAGELSSEECRAIEEHLCGCPYCRELRRRFNDLDGLLAEWAKQEVPPRLIEGTLQDIQQRIYGRELPKDEILTPEEVAIFLKIPVETVYQMTNVMPFIRFGEHLRIRRESLLAWIEETESRSRRRALASSVHERIGNE